MDKPKMSKGIVAFILVEIVAGVLFTAIAGAVFYKQVTTDPTFAYIGDLISSDSARY